MTTRRNLLAALAAAPLALNAAEAKIPRRIGIQLYLFGPEAVRDLPRVLAAVRTIGYREVELPHLYGRNAAQLSAMLRAEGLACPSLHMPLEGRGMTLAAPEAVAETLDRLGARYAVVGLPPIAPKTAKGESWAVGMARAAREATVADWQQIAAGLDRAGAVLARHGMRAGYHNHDMELLPIGGRGPTPLDLLADATDPRHVVFELDLAWAVVAGADPAALLRRHARRIHLLHLKDTAGSMSPDAVMSMKPVDPGRGLIDWRKIRTALGGVPVAHMFVEQEPPYVGSRIDAARDGFAFFDRLARGR